MKLLLAVLFLVLSATSFAFADEIPMSALYPNQLSITILDLNTVKRVAAASDASLAFVHGQVQMNYVPSPGNTKCYLDITATVVWNEVPNPLPLFQNPSEFKKEDLTRLFVSFGDGVLQISCVKKENASYTLAELEDAFQGVLQFTRN